MVAKEGDVLPALDAPVWIEARPERHPLAGILEALERAAGRAVLVCACDMPFVTAELVAHLAPGPGRSVPEAGGRLHPLLARYDPAAAGALSDCAGRARAAARSGPAGRRGDRPGGRDRRASATRSGCCST